MVYKFLETKEVDINIDFQKLYDFVRDKNYSDVIFEIDSDVVKELKEYRSEYIMNCFDFGLDSLLEGYNHRVMDKIVEDFAEWVKNKN